MDIINYLPQYLRGYNLLKTWSVDISDDGFDDGLETVGNDEPLIELYNF